MSGMSELHAELTKIVREAILSHSHLDETELDPAKVQPYTDRISAAMSRDVPQRVVTSTSHQHEGWQLRDDGCGRYCGGCGVPVPLDPTELGDVTTPTGSGSAAEDCEPGWTMERTTWADLSPRQRQALADSVEHGLWPAGPFTRGDSYAYAKRTLMALADRGLVTWNLGWRANSLGRAVLAARPDA